MTESEIARLRRQVSTLEAENARLRAGAVEASGGRDQHYRAIFESAVDFAVIAMDRDGRVTDWNTGAERILGWSAEEMQGEPADRIFTPEDRSEGRPGIEMRCALETGRAGDDCWHLRRDGSRFWARGETMPLRGQDGVQLGYIKILRDRTEQARAVEALRRSEETLRLALDAGQAVGAWNWDIVNDRVYADARFAQLYSVDPARAASGAPIAEFMAGMHPEDRDRVGLGVQRAVEEAGEFAEEYRLVQGDGSVRWVLARGRAYHDEVGNPTRFPGITVDITGRKGVEEALRASEERLRIAQRAGGVGTFEWYPDTGKLDVSDEYRRIWGLAPGAQVTADLLVSLLHPEDRALSGPARLRLGENPLEYTEYRITRPDTGEERWIARRGEVLPARGGVPQRFLGVAFDITEHKRTEAALAESEAHFRATFEQAAVGVAHVDLDGRWLRVNARLCAILGYTETDLLARTFQEITHPDDLAANLVHIRQLLSGEAASVSFEKRYVRGDGGTVWAAIATVLRRDPRSGAPLHFISVFQDITARKRTEDALRESEEQLRLATEAAEIGLWDVDMVTATLFWPPRVKAMFGISPDVPVSMADFYAGLHPDDREHVSAAFAAALDPAQRALYDVEYRTIGKEDGILRWVAAKGRGLFGADGACLRVLGTAIDISARKAAEQALRESEARFRALVTASSDVVYCMSPDWSEMRWLDGRGLIADMPRPSRSWLEEFIHPDDQAHITATIQAAIRAKGIFELEHRVRRVDGSLGWTLSRAVPLLDADGGIEEWFGAAGDITGRIEAEAALRRQAEEFQTLADNIPTLCWMAYADGHIYWYNRRWYDYTGTDPESQAGWGWESVHDPECLPQVVERWRHSIATGEKFEMTFPMRGADGVFRPFLTRIVPIRGDDGKIVRWFGTNTDITEQREAEDALRLLTENLEVIVEERTHERDMVWRVSQDLFVLCGLDGFYRSANPAWTDALGYTLADLIGARFEDFVHPEDVPATRREFERLFRGAVIRDFDIRLRAKGGSYRWYSWYCVPEGGEFYAAGRDVTERKLLEEQLRQSQKMEAVGQLTGGLAHDFNNLLTGIAGSLELMQARLSQGRTNDLDRYILAAQGASKRAAALTHRLLAFSRRQTLDPKPTKVDGLVAGMEELIRRTVGPAIEVEVVGSAGLWPALVDPNQLESALLNLCINARDAMPDGGRLTIETANKWLDERAARERELAPGQYLSLCVTDTGTGMTPEVAKRAFDPFFTTKPIGVGTGLGLSMVYGFARQSGGQVRIYTELGEGTTMCLYLPRYLGDDGDAESAELAGAPRSEQGETVLVVDDEPTVRMLVTEVLETLGYTAIEAADGAAGLKVLQSDIRIDLLVTDVGLPGGMNGRQVADAGRAVRPGLKVLFITGYAENAVVGNGHLEPGMQVLTKPFTIEALASRIKDLIAGT